MAKWAHDDVMDASCDQVATANLMLVCSDQPTDRADALTLALADVALTPGDGNGDFTVANGDSSGRKVTVAQQASILVDTSGDATHVALVDDTRLILVNTCTLQTLTAGNTVTVPAFDDEFGDPA